MKNVSFFLILLGMITIMSAIVYADTLPDTAALGAPFPSRWDSSTLNDNYTYYNAAPQSLNYTRGFIYELVIAAAQNTHRWIGYVGNITGNISLMDNSRNKLYGWDLAITSGELYATRFTGSVATGSSNAALDGSGQRASGTQGISDYDYIDWTNVDCATREYIENESIRLGHNRSVDNDDLNTTFELATQGMDFEVADNYIDMSADSCSAINLYSSSAPSTGWQEVVLEDGSTDGVRGDIIFASIIEDDSVGFNGQQYDFQIILPQYGQVLQDTTDGNIKDNIEYYFYLELIGEKWPTEAVR